MYPDPCITEQSFIGSEFTETVTYNIYIYIVCELVYHLECSYFMQNVNP